MTEEEIIQLHSNPGLKKNAVSEAPSGAERTEEKPAPKLVTLVTAKEKAQSEAMQDMIERAEKFLAEIKAGMVAGYAIAAVRTNGNLSGVISETGVGPSVLGATLHLQRQLLDHMEVIDPPQIEDEGPDQA